MSDYKRFVWDLEDLKETVEALQSHLERSTPQKDYVLSCLHKIENRTRWIRVEYDYRVLEGRFG